jgi:hypothetical protein
MTNSDLIRWTISELLENRWIDPNGVEIKQLKMLSNRLLLEEARQNKEENIYKYNKDGEETE